MSQVYELIGRIVVAVVRWRFGRQIRIAAAGAGVAALAALGAYVALRGNGSEES
ncbi:MAG TPA: hypothetical protein VHH72_08185 [Solirubrobacterales bacterium]|jgi:hypothetical protein|nr:hypothetical protein [Solirubrobacterales bacterium]